jgi:orotidine-5'-phosphate decarboxylase
LRTGSGPHSPHERRALLAEAAETFCSGVIDVVADLVPAVKPQVAFFEALGSPGVLALERVVARARDAGLLVVLDAKRGDIGSTAKAYVQATLADDGPIGADAVTLSPYLGPESMDPFVSCFPQGKGIFVLVRTSNPGAEEWQLAGEPSVSRRVAAWIGEQNHRMPGSWGPVGAVVGANLSQEARVLRSLLPRAWFLVPGYGEQGAGASDCRSHLGADGLGALIVSARGVLFAPRGDDGAAWRDAVRHRTVTFVDDLRVNLTMP